MRPRDALAGGQQQELAELSGGRRPTLMITASSHSEKLPFFTAGLRWFHHLRPLRGSSASAGAAGAQERPGRAMGPTDGRLT